VTPPNDNDRFFSLVAEHKGILDKVANGYCRNRDDRGDLIQEIVIQLWQSFPRSRPWLQPTNRYQHHLRARHTFSRICFIE